MRLTTTTLLLSTLALSACGPKSEAPSNTHAESALTSACTSQAFKQVMDSYHEGWLALNPMAATYYDKPEYNDQFGDGLSDEWLEKRHQLSQTALTQAQGLDASCYPQGLQITLSEFIRARELDLIGETFPERFIPFTQFYSAYSSFIQFGSGSSAQPFNTVEEFHKFAKRAEGFSEWVDLAIARMKEGMESEVTLPRVLAERALAQLESVASNPDIFYQPLKRQEQQQTLSADELEKVTLSHSLMVEETIVPAFRRLVDFMKGEYLAACRASDGYWGLPNGRLWYKHYVNSYVDDSRTPEQIHQLGLQEVARIHKQMQEIGVKLGVGDDLATIFKVMASDEKYFYGEGQQLVDDYMALKKTINPILPSYFSEIPKQDYEVREVEAFRAANAAGASYQVGSRDGARPGIFYINTHNLKAQPKWGMMTLSLHEASPGHHFQLSHQLSMTPLSDYQLYASNTAYVEGWALYAEYLGLEMGLFEKPLDHFGKLSDELLRAMRLVIDTGLHDKGWSREQAIEYMKQSSPMAESDVVSEVERYMALPGQAVSYKLGEQTILELRRQAESQLKDKFDIREFHQQVLEYGALSMPALRRSINQWLEKKKEGQGASSSSA